MTAILLFGAYAIGSIPIGYLVPKLARGIDVRTVGSGNPGFTNVYRAAGALPGAIVLFADIGKGVLAVLLARRFGGGDLLPVLAGIFAVTGHVTTPFLRFRGGKGVATALGVFATLVPLATAVCFVLFLAVVSVSRFISLGSVAAAIALPVTIFLAARLRGDPLPVPELLFATAVGLLIVVRHLSNMRRLVAGTENKFTFRRGEGS